MWLQVILVALCARRNHANNPAEESRYECGAHGRFEYCIDGNLGCVVGCHCHPGYYFDTNTKVCEHNFKLQEDLMKLAQNKKLTTTTTESPSSPRVDKENDDNLGEWLYNQFFKTLENQVINETSSTETPTRRLGNSPLKKNNNMFRSGKKTKKRKYKKKKSRLDQRRKLLKIPENDSVFDSSSSESSEDSSSSDSSGSSGSSSSSSDETSDGKQSCDDKDHEHKKFLVINKHPKRPLPSFIFLPNMDTPFYPPVGLPLPPPPPAYPMYPMVPVPPFVQVFPLPTTDETTKSNNETITTATVSSTTMLVTTAATTTSKPTTVSSVATEAITVSTLPPTEITEANNKTDALRKGPYGNRHGRKKLEEDVLRHSFEYTVSSSTEELITRKNKMQKMMRERQKRLKAQMEQATRVLPPNTNKMVMPPTNQFNEDFQSPYYDDSLKADQEFNKPNVQNRPELEDVDFKYLTELIHRVHPNASKDMLHPGPFDTQPINSGAQSIGFYSGQSLDLGSPPINSLRPHQIGPVQYQADMAPNKMNPRMQKPEKINVMQKPKTFPIIEQQREIFTRRTYPESALQDDSFYSNLGKQIASLIRNMNKKDAREVNIEIEQIAKPDPSIPPLLYENSFASRSYWERSVRSPYKSKIPFLVKSRGKLNDLYSNEILFDLEDQAQTAVTTMKTLSLIDLENLINVMDSNDNKIDTEHELRSNNNLINLLPPNRPLLNQADIKTPYETTLYSKKYSGPQFFTDVAQKTISHDSLPNRPIKHYTNINIDAIIQKNDNLRPINHHTNLLDMFNVVTRKPYLRKMSNILSGKHLNTYNTSIGNHAQTLFKDFSKKISVKHMINKKVTPHVYTNNQAARMNKVPDKNIQYVNEDKEQNYGDHNRNYTNSAPQQFASLKYDINHIAYNIDNENFMKPQQKNIAYKNFHNYLMYPQSHIFLKKSQFPQFINKKIFGHFDYSM